MESITEEGFRLKMCKSGRVDLASEIYQQMVTKALKADLVLYNTLVNGFCKGGYFRESRKLVGEMTKRGGKLRTLGGGSIYLEMATDPEQESSLFLVLKQPHGAYLALPASTLSGSATKWSDLVDCLTLKTKRSSQVQEILEAREKAKPHLWKLRTPEEASVHWRKLFGHLDDEVE
ncbi:hypothetical protein OIU85_028435 [Salix viminalis]|uniref:Pentatricopeptide repeat-containing protein n=1 Tax=Salix viminalis TaxID=40686 RepID=A0A9Q0QK33_SALVM|nr:hypothetical protein OIU85_028435 [Salix viminalis]